MDIKFNPLPSGKYTFCVEGNENATAYLLKNTITHVIKPSGMKFAIAALKALLKDYNPRIDYTKNESNPVVALSEFIQSKYGQSIRSHRISTITNKKQETEITVEIIALNRSFSGIGRNQRIARQEAAKKAIVFFQVPFDTSNNNQKI